MAKNKQIKDSAIVRTNQMFVSLKAIGEVDEKGKTVMSLGYGGKIIADPDAPLMTMLLPVVSEVASMAKWSSNEAAEKDLESFKKAIASLKFKGT